MTKKDFLKKLTSLKGSAYMLVPNNELWVKVVKSDFPKILQAYDDNEETGIRIDDNGFIGNDHESI